MGLGRAEGDRARAQGHGVPLRGAERAAHPRRPAAASAPPLSRRRVLRRRCGEHVSGEPVVQAARRAGKTRPVVVSCVRRPAPGRSWPRTRRPSPSCRRSATSRAFIQDQDIRVVLYVNDQNTRNFQMFRDLAPLARVHQPRRVRQDVHDHQPVQGVRSIPSSSPARRRGTASSRVLWDYDVERADDRDRASAGRPLLRCGFRTRRTDGPWCSTRRRGRATGHQPTTAPSSVTVRRWCGPSWPRVAQGYF